jgi:hypothetical protein
VVGVVNEFFIPSIRIKNVLEARNLAAKQIPPITSCPVFIFCHMIARNSRVVIKGLKLDLQWSRVIGLCQTTVYVFKAIICSHPILQGENPIAGIIIKDSYGTSVWPFYGVEAAQSIVLKVPPAGRDFAP